MGVKSRPGASQSGRHHVLALFSAVAMVALLPQCDNGAVGVDGCRDIETARCHAVVGCPHSPVETEADVENCELFYRDQCMHGVADAISPDQATVDACIAAIDLARACWDQQQPLGACVAAHVDAGSAAPAIVAGVDPNLSGCDAIMVPQILQACSFLEPPPAPVGGSGGAAQGGAGGSASPG